MNAPSRTSCIWGREGQYYARKQLIASELAIHVPNPIPDTGEKQTISAPSDKKLSSSLIMIPVKAEEKPPFVKLQ